MVSTNEGNGMTEFKLQASLKDNDGDMVNFRADSNEELAHHLQNFPYADYAAAKAALRGAANAAPITQPAQSHPVQQHPTNPAPTQAQQGGWGQPAQQQGPALHPEGESCHCGMVLQYKVVSRKSDGKQFKFWVCPNQRSRDDGHRSEFA